MISVAKRAGEKRKLSQGKANETEAEGTRIGSPLSTVNTFSASAPKIQIKDRKLGTPVTLPAPVKVEHSIVTQSLIECIGSRLSQEVWFDYIPYLFLRLIVVFYTILGKIIL